MFRIEHGAKFAFEALPSIPEPLDS